MSSSNLKRGIILSYVSLFVGIICSFIYSHYATSILSTEQYGLFTTGTALMGYLSLLTFGLSGTVVRFASKYIARGKKIEESALYGFFILIFCVVSFIALTIGLIIIYFEPQIFKTAGPAEDKQLRLIILFMLVNLCISFPCSVFNSIICSYERFVFLKIVNIIVSISTPLTVVPLLFLGKEAVEITFVIQTIHIIANLSYIVFSFLRLRIKISFRIKVLNKDIFKEIFAFSAFIFLGSVCDQLYWSTDKFILSIFVGQTAVAIYGVGAMFHSYFQQFSGSISEVLFPRITKDITSGASLDSINKTFLKTSRILIIVLLFIMSGFVIFGKDFIYFFTNKHEYDDAFYIALLVMIPATVPLAQSTAFLVIKALGKHKFRAVIYLIIAIINASISIPLGMAFGGIGCAAATCVCALIGHGLIMNIYYKKKIGLNIKGFWVEFIKILLPIVFYSFLTYAILNRIDTENIFLLLFEIIVYSIGFFVLCFFVLLNNDEKKLLNSFFSKFKRKH